jgi:hypothetical protein
MAMNMFAAIKSQQEIELGKWVDLNGGEKAVLGDDEKTKGFLERQNALSTTHDANNSQLVPSAGGRNKSASAPTASDNEAKTVTKALTDFRKEYREDLDEVLKDNLETFSKTFQMGFDKLNEDLSNKIQHEGDRIISFLKGPSSRLKDKVGVFSLRSLSSVLRSTVDHVQSVEGTGKALHYITEC